jgi:PTH1 family peptidyl-tRNA hydrolase
VKLIVGLGNPGIFYSGTRHNIGFQVIKYLAKDRKFALKKEKGVKVLSAKGKLDGIDAVLAMPLTFMNLSGEALAPLLKKYNVGSGDLLVVCDDLDLEFGQIKIRAAGSSAGHRGIQSIVDSLGTNEFNRIRVGIGRPKGADASDYVLSHFKRDERIQLPEIISRAKECCISWAVDGVEKSMSIFNRSINSKELKE